MYEILACDHSCVTVDFERASFRKIGRDHTHTHFQPQQLEQFEQLLMGDNIMT